MSTQKNTSHRALVLKSKATGEGDLLVTLLTPEQGKILVVAKGARRLTSSRRAHLESGNLITAYLVTTKSLPILSQTRLLADSGPCRENLKLTRRLFEYLEILDAITVAEEIELTIFAHLLHIRELIINQSPHHQIKTALSQLLTAFGISEENPLTTTPNLSALVSDFTGRKLLAFEYLRNS